MQGGQFGKAMQEPSGDDRPDCAAVLHTEAAPGHGFTFSALAIGAMTLAIGTTSMARITYDSAPSGYGRAIARSELLLATAIAPPFSTLYDAPIALAASQPLVPPPVPLAPLVMLPHEPARMPVPRPAPQPAPPSMSPPAEARAPRFVGVEIHAGMPPGAIAGGATNFPIAANHPRLHQCDPRQAVQADTGIHCPEMIAANGPTLVTGKTQPDLVASNDDVDRLAPADSAISPEPAILVAQAAVEAAPHDAAMRYELGAAYLKAGRFASAASALGDAVALGNDEERTILALAMSLAGAGRGEEAVSLLADREDQLGRANLGVTLALVGEPSLGSQVLEDAIIGGASDAGTRQDLALAYTLAGRWREARSLAVIDLGPSQAHQRIAKWLETSQPHAAPQRIARYLQIGEPSADPGLPARLALDTSPVTTQQVMLAEGTRADPIADLAPATAAAGPEPAIASSPVAIALSDEAAGIPANVDTQGSIAVALGDAVAGHVPLHLVSASTGAVRLGDLLALFEGQMDGDLHAALSASPSARELVTFDRLAANGIAVTRDLEGKRISLGLAEI